MTLTGFRNFCFIITTALVLMTPGEAFRSNTVVNDNAKEYDLDFPTCATESACGLLQVNVRGLAKRPLCKCTKSPCPMNWDEKDGFSVTQGSDQYKFCDPVPKLRRCKATQVAFTGRLQYSHITKQQIKSDRLHCICPGHYTYHLISSDLSYSDSENENREWKYVCAPYTECKVGSVCKTIRVDGPEFLVEKECNCPEGLRCPTTTKNAIKRPNFWSKESLYEVHCQKKTKKPRKFFPKKVCIRIHWYQRQ